MGEDVRFAAPWGTRLTLTTGLVVGAMVLVVVLAMVTGAYRDAPTFLAMVGLPMGVVAGGALFLVRGYVVTGDAVVVERLGWKSRIDLGDLVSAEADPEAMDRSLRLFGNGGLFCFAGLFRNRKLGSYRAFATDPSRSVVLRFAERTVVVTPEDPAAFVARIAESRG